HARTDYSVIENYKFASLIKLKLHTGRTHQIRVHLSHIKHPVFGDPAYGGDKCLYTGLGEINKIANKCVKSVNRQLLHAKTLGFVHPALNKFMKFDSDLPPDFVNIINIIKNSEIFDKG